MTDSQRTNLIEALERLSHHTPMQFQEGLETLLVYVKNLITHPEDGKFRKIKISNIHFQERLGHMDGSKEALTAIGFRQEGDFYVFDTPASSAEELIKILDPIEKILEEAVDDVKREMNALPVRLPSNHFYSSVRGASCHSERGKRATMEDDEILVDKFCGKARAGYFGLYDGHGGRGVVNYVVKALHKNIEYYLQLYPDAPIPEALRAGYLTTDGQVRRANILHSGTTSVSCIIREEPDENSPTKIKRMMYCANVGDSRAILCRNGVAMRMTIDHKPNLPDEMKRISDAGGFVGRCNRVNGLLAISRALGDHMLKPNEVVSAVPYTSQTELTAADTYLLLACDGVWDVMEDQEAIDFILARVKDFEADPSNIEDGPRLNEKLFEVSQALVKEALDKKSQDNITVMIIRL